MGVGEILLVCLKLCLYMLRVHGVHFSTIQYISDYPTLFVQVSYDW